MPSLLAFSADQIRTFATEAWSAFSGASRFREVPPLQPRLGLVGETMLDRSFTLATSLMMGVPRPEEVRRQNEEAVEMRGFLRAEGYLEQPELYHATPPPLLEDETELEPAGVWLGPSHWRYEELRFPSGYEPPVGAPGRERWLAHPQNGQALAYVFEHEGRPRPWVVGVHGFSMGTPLINSVGFPLRMLHERLGLNVVLPVLPLHGERTTARFSGAEVMGPDYVQMVHLFSQATWDVRRVLSWVRERGAQKVGLYGISMGAYVSSLVAAFEDDLEALAVSIPMVDFATSAQDNMPWVMQRYDEALELEWELLRELTHVVSPLNFTPRLPKNRRFIYAGIADRIVRPPQPRALWRHWGEPEIEWFSGGHVLGIFDRGLEPFLEQALRQSGLVYRKRKRRRKASPRQGRRA